VLNQLELIALVCLPFVFGQSVTPRVFPSWIVFLFCYYWFLAIQGWSYFIPFIACGVEPKDLSFPSLKGPSCFVPLIITCVTNIVNSFGNGSK
jgi:hypothetical protein